MAGLPRAEQKCAGCGAVPEKYKDLVAVEGNDYRLLGYLCPGRGHFGAVKTACMSAWLMKRALRCMVCDVELMDWKPQNRVRPICGSCEGKLDAMVEREKGRRWYRVDVFDMLGLATPGNTHADYRAVGEALLQALGSAGRQVDGAEWLQEKSGRRVGDRSCDGTVELTEEQAAGLRRFQTAFAEYVETVAAAKHREGNSLLVRLARGEVSVDQYNHEAKKGERNGARDDDEG